jgi:hypothetical protein
VELIARYEEEKEAEKAAPQKPLRPSVKQRFVDLLFPHTIKYKSKKAREGKNGKEARKGRRGKKVSEEEVRKSAEKKFEYWIRLGTPL